MAVTMNADWVDMGVQPVPTSLATYVLNGQPIEEYDNWFNYSVVQDIQAVINDVINRYSANTILKADVANTPIALTVGEQTIIGRKTGASIDALNAVDVKAVVGQWDDSDTLDGYHAGTSSGQVPISNGSICTNLNADMVDGCHTGTGVGRVHQIMAMSHGDIFFANSIPAIAHLGAGIEGYQLTTHGAAANPTWSDIALLRDGTRAMTSNFNMGTFAITSVGNVDGRDVSVDGTKLDTIAASANNYSHPSAPPCRASTAAQTGHATAAQISKLNGIASGANNYSHPGTIQCNANNYSHPSARACSSGSWAWGSISGKPGTYPPTAHDLDSHNACTLAELSADITDATLIGTGDSRLSDARTPTAHNQSAATITSGILSTSRGGTGVTGDTYDADKVDGCHAGTTDGNVWKIQSGAALGVTVVGTIGSGIDLFPAGTNGYQLTTHGAGVIQSWDAASDLIFSDTHCPKCGLEFQAGEILVLYLIGKNEVGDILTIPMHQSCSIEPKKIVTIKRKVMEDQYILDELTGKPKVQRVEKMQEKTVTKHKLKEGYALDNVTGKALKTTKDGNRGKTKYNLADALETVEETVSEVVTEDVEFLL